MRAAFALRIISGKIIFNFAFGATAFAERSAAMKAPVGLLSGRAVCVSRWRGVAPTSSAERSKRYFHGRGRREKRHFQRRFLRKHGAAVSALALSVTFGDSSPKGRALGSPRKLHLFAKASPFGRGGCERSEQTERARPLAGVSAPRGELSRSD